MQPDSDMGRETSEWGVMKWVAFVAGLLGTVTGALTAALPASGAVPADSVVVVVLGVVTTVCLAVGGKVSSEYIKGRAAVKVSRNQKT